MPRVPYNPVPDVAPQSPGEQFGIATPGAAFGENIGAALKQLGGSVDQAGNELFARALALQELRNQNEARDAQTEFATESSKLHAQFNTLTGKAAADGLDGYLKAQADLRKQIRSRLTSPMAQQHYDSDSLPFMQRNVFSAAGHAAEENRKYTIDTYSAEGAIIKRGVEDDPGDEGAFERNGARLREAATQAASLRFGVHDPNDPNVKNAVEKEMQSYYAAKIKGVARTDPWRAMRLLEENKGNLGDEYEPLRAVIETRGNTIASSGIADKILDSHRQADGTYDATYQDMQNEVREEARSQFPDNKTLPEHSVSVFDSKLVRARFAAEQDKREALHQIDTAILNNNITDTQQLFALPGMAQVVERYGKFDPKGAAELQAHIFNINQAANRITREESKAYIYHGLANGGPDGKIDEFLKVDPFDPKWHLSADDAKAIIQKQYQVSRSMKTDPKVNSAFTAIVASMGGQLNDLGVIGSSRDITKFYAFKGALGAMLEEWQMENKRPPTNEEIVQKIGPAIVRQMGSPPATVFGMHVPFTGDQGPLYEKLQKHVEEVIQAAKDKEVEVPSEDEIRRAYLAQTFQQLFGGSPGQSGSDQRPAAPISR